MVSVGKFESLVPQIIPQILAHTRVKITNHNQLKQLNHYEHKTRIQNIQRMEKIQTLNRAPRRYGILRELGLRA